ncbi:MAG TPA: peptidase, partial [Thermoanaerobaculia bacterium]|nr:peptidase [Thermoanaerobaculia bacterium]
MRRILLLLAMTLVSTSAFAARLVIQNNDAAGQGFNDATPAAPVGGNPGTTLGQQRLIAFQRAADLWGAALESNVDIVIGARFAPINENPACDDSGGTLGSAGPTQMLFNFEHAPKQNVAYPVALANKFAGRDLMPGSPDINARFNSLVDNATCLGTRGWYYGLDGNHGDDIDLLVVLLHEFGHGLGVSGNVDLRTG